MTGIGKRLLSCLTSAAMAAAAVLPSGLQLGDDLLARASDVENIGSGTASDDITLLFGKPKDSNELIVPGDFDATVDNYNSGYLLAVASQFAVFVSDYFVPYECDAEGRMAVGSHFETKTGWGSYEVGNGDYRSGVNLTDFLPYTDYARVVWGAETKTGDYGEAALKGMGWGADQKSIVFDKGQTVDGKTASEYISELYSDKTEHFYAASPGLINFSDQFDILRARSAAIAKRPNEFSVSSVESTEKPGTTIVTVKYTGTKDTAECVYLNLDKLTAAERDMFRNATVVRFEDIPRLSEPRTSVDIWGNPTTWEYSYIVVNDSSSGDVHYGHQANSGGWYQRYTSIRGKGETVAKNISLSRADSSGLIMTEGGYELDNASLENNEFGVSSLLFNYPNASRVIIDSSGQGSILAPDALVTDLKFLRYAKNEIDGDVSGDNPHVSGAIIAKAFEGYSEIGHRSFTGPISIAGLTTGYEASFSKVEAISTTPLAGATIGFFPVEDDGTVAALPAFTAESDGTRVQAAALDAGKYEVREIEAPDGYALDDTKYYIEIVPSEEKKLEKKEYRENVSLILYSGSDFGTAVDTYSCAPLDVYNNIYTDGADRYRISGSGGNITSVKNVATNALADASRFSLTEVDASKGWYIPSVDGDTLIAVCDFNSDAPFVFTDQQAVTIRKVDTSGRPLEGAEFTLYKYTPRTGPGPGGGRREEEKGKLKGDTVYAILTGAGDDQIDTAGADGYPYYKIKETVAPDGYKKLDQSIYFRLTSDGKFQTGKYATATTVNWDEPVDVRLITVVNEYQGMMIGKYAQNGTDMDTSEPVSGAKVDLYSCEGDVLLVEDIFSGTEGEVTVVDLKAKGLPDNYAKSGKLVDGYYYLKETEPPPGFEAPASPQYFKVEGGKASSCGKVTISKTVLGEQQFDGPKNDFQGFTKFWTGTPDTITVSLPDGVTAKMIKLAVNGSWADYQGKTFSDANSGTWTLDKNFNSIQQVYIDYQGGVDYIRITLSGVKTEITGTSDNLRTPGDGLNIQLGNTRNTNITFKKRSDRKVLSSVDKSSYSTTADDTPLAGAKMKLTLTAPDTAGNDLSGVTAVSGTIDAVTSPDFITWTTGSEDVVLSGIPDGKYTLEETAAPAGYQPVLKTNLTVKNGAVTVDSSDTDVASSPGTVTATDRVYSVSVRKTTPTGEGDTPVAGAKMRITGVDAENKAISFAGVQLHDNQIFAGNGLGINNGDAYLIDDTLIPSISADANEYVWYSTGSAVIFTMLPEGTYTIEELEAPAGYFTAQPKVFTVSKNTETGRFEVTDGADSGYSYERITVSDETQTIKISKTDMGGTVIEGADLELRRKDGGKLGSLSVTGKNDTAANVVTSVDDDNDGYDKNDKKVVIQLKGAKDFTIRGNTFKHVKVNGAEVDSSVNRYTYSGTAAGDTLTIEGLYDGVYVVTLSDGTEYTIRVNYDETEVAYVNVAKKGDISADGKKLSFTGGAVDIAGLEDGTYVLREVNAPAGGYTTISEFEFRVTGGKVDKTSVKATTDGDIIGGAVDVDTNGGLLIKDDKQILNIVKKELADDGSEKEISKLSGGLENPATFRLIPKASDDSLIGVTVGGKKLAEADLDSDRAYTFTGNDTQISGLKDGSVYTLEETVAPVGYNKLVVSGFDFTIVDGKAVLVSASTNGEYKVSADGKTITVLDTISTITISKEAFGSAVLAPENKAEFTLKSTDTDLEGVTIDGGTALGKTDKVSFTGNNAEIKGLKDGKYELTEIAAPDGFTKVTTSFKFEIENGVIKSSTTVTDGNSSISATDNKTIVATDDISTISISKEAFGSAVLAPENKAEFTLKSTDTDLEGVTIDG
ncbi:MAG: hypothetical protein IKO47_11265, partial [Ruminococcus sp.]|nr:hypothetical protein [Ruminococcus sp.]